jgi:hypothetical protein
MADLGKEIEVLEVDLAPHETGAPPDSNPESEPSEKPEEVPELIPAT